MYCLVALETLSFFIYIKLNVVTLITLKQKNVDTRILILTESICYSTCVSFKNTAFWRSSLSLAVVLHITHTCFLRLSRYITIFK